MAYSNTLAQDLIAQYEALRSERKKLEPVWEEISRHMLPRPLNFATKVDVSAEDMHPPDDIIDSTARVAVSIFAAGMLSGVSSPTTQWFKITATQQDQNDLVNEDHEVARWCEYVTSILSWMLQNHNFYGQQVEGYEYLGALGHSCIFVGLDESTQTPVYRSVDADTYCFAEGANGLANVVFRDLYMTGAQLIQRFGDSGLSADLKSQAESSAGMNQRFRVVHAVLQKDAGYENLMGSNKLPFAGYFYEPDSGNLIEEGGYESMPYIITRAHHTARTVYSSSFGLMALADCKMLNEMRKLELQAAQVAVAPPMIAPDNKLLKHFSFEPWALNAYNKREGVEAKDFMAVPMNADPRMLEGAIQDAVRRINSTFNVDMFLMLQQRTQGRGTPTAREVIGLQEEKAFILGPLLNNLHQENFGQLFTRSFDIARQLNLIPEAPRAVVERGMKLLYLSPLMIAQHAERAGISIRALAEIGGVVGQINPEALDNFNLDAMTRDSALLKGVPATQLRTVEEVAQLRQQRQEMQMQQMRAQQAERQQVMAADAYSKTTKAPEMGSAAEGLMQQAQKSAQTAQGE